MKADVIARRRSLPSAAPRIWVPLVLIFIGLAAAPLFGMPQFAQSLIIEILIFSLLALSLNILLGYTGLVSFGHAAFFGIGGMRSPYSLPVSRPTFWSQCRSP
jgi:branched-chain amino acid transport system permease protein